MLFNRLVGLALVSATAAHVIRSESDRSSDGLGDWCGNEKPAADLLRDVGDDEPIVDERGDEKTYFTVNTYFHIVTNSTRVQDGWLTDKTIAAQLKVLNHDYAPSGIAFKLKGVGRQVHKTWATTNKPAELLAMKKALRQGDYKTLNVYFRTDLGPSSTGKTLLGQCSFPGAVKAGSDAFFLDGCMIYHRTTPGGPIPDANLGKTATHEVGHWFGLFHTFQGGCSGGDFVADTPPQANSTVGCPIGKDTCAAPGLDPIHNYMDYSSDACVNQFTPGQNRRIYKFWNTYRH